ncbi:MAG: A/G-specific adenine glycosylase [Oscillospiraceae bacterium]|nr:A/G-specific adenine glycosylase [Oscillospiraceae bacterium]
MRRLAAEKAALPQAMLRPLLAWYPEHHRALPWRETADPYRVWVSEIMLQQTRVEAVKGYYARFLEALPDVQALADCPEERLLKLWEGLGYYNRVRNMQKAARQIIAQHGGRFPQSYAEIRALPGIGDYTAGAVCSLCYGMPVPAVDGNVLRVMARLQEDFRNVLDGAVKADITARLAAVYPQADCAMLTQALMEIGATVCVPNGAPDCESCPLGALCMARQAHSERMLPVREKKTTRRTEQRTVFVLECEGKIAIRKRPARGLLASLYELPNVAGRLSPEEAIAQCSTWGVRPQALEKTVERRHIFTHITWEMQGVFLRCGAMPEGFVWADAAALAETYSLPTAFRCVLAGEPI